LGWEGGFARETGKSLKPRKRLKNAARTPSRLHALLGARNADFHHGSDHQTHHVRFYPQPKFRQSPKKITTQYDLYEAETRPSEKLTLRWKKTEPKNLDKFFAKHLLKKRLRLPTL
jgi:hypothetical protein